MDRPLRVCVYGGTDLDGVPSRFISEVAYAILDSMPAVIVTGGYLYSDDKPRAISTDAAALTGARRYAAERREALADCFQAWLPEPSLDNRREDEGTIRMGAAQGIEPKVLKGRTPLGRRLSMIANVDLVVTISGKRHTEVIIEQAMEVGIPVLPIPDAGGDSRALLQKYRGRVAASFGEGALDACLAEVSRLIESDPGGAARAAVALLRTAKIGQCLVLFPYDEEHRLIYASELEGIVTEHMRPICLDRVPGSEPIYTTFADTVRACSAVIADVTKVNENVMYEIGYANGSGLKPLLYTRSVARLKRLPVYFRTLNVRLVTANAPLNAVVAEYLRAVKASRGLRRLLQ